MSGPENTTATEASTEPTAATAAEIKEKNAAVAAKANGTDSSNGGSADEEDAKQQLTEEEEEELLGEDEEDSQPAVNGNGSSKNGNSAEPVDIDDDDEEEEEEAVDDDEILEEDDEMGDEMDEDDEEGFASRQRDVEEVRLDDDSNSVEAISNGGGSEKSSGSRRKAPLGSRDVEEDDDIEEVKDDDSGIVEVDAEDPRSSSGATITKRVAGSSLTFGEKPKSNVVTIDDPKMLQRLANSASSQKQGNGGHKTNLMLANSLLAGKGTSGVTITPAKPKQVPGIISQLGSGVTISQTSRGSSPAASFGASTSATITTKQSSSAAASGGELNDPNLKEETVVVEMPSFITPYIFENPPKETFKDFKEDIKKQSEELKKKKEEESAKKKEEAEKVKEAKKEAKEARRKAREEDGDFDPDKADDSASSEEEAAKSDGDDSSSESDDDSDVIEIEKKPSASENYFESPLGEFIFDIGMNLVQEAVQQDLLKQQIRKSQKDKSAGVMHAIMSLRKNLKSSKEKNEVFKLKEQKCRFCSFKTESATVLQQHLETPHMKMGAYRCNFCPYDTRIPQEVLAHMWTEHGIRGRLERAPAMHQCPQCPYEDNMKGKLTRHKNSCDKRFRPEKNQEAPLDWEPPAKIPKPKVVPQVPFGRRGNMPMMGPAGQFGQRTLQSGMGFQGQQKSLYPGMPQLQLGAKGRGRPVGAYKGDLGAFGGGNLSINRTNKPIPGLNHLNRGSNNPLLRNPPGSKYPSNNILSNLGTNSSVTIQSVSQRSGHNRSSTAPSISITPLSGRQGAAAAGFGNNAQRRSAGPSSLGGNMKAGAPPSAGAQGKGSFVICEICDGYIRDLEQLRNHMLYIHKVKIHPKMIHNRPPLNCQKCQFRFFTDQGLERHLLGSHGLVTASMQELANKGQDQGRCPVCGKVYQWKLLNHVAKDHQKVLKPAHLSYKCTVCTATFGQYKLFENHVYQAHSGAAKKGEKSKQGPSAAASKPGNNPLKGSNLKIPNDISIIPKPGGSAAKRSKAANDPDVIELDDEEEEIDDVEDESAKRPGQKRPAAASASSAPSDKQPRQEEESDEEGIEEIEDEEPEED